MTDSPPAQLLLEALPDPVLAVNANLDLIDINPAAAEVFESDTGEILGTKLTQWVPGLQELIDRELGVPDAASLLQRAAKEGQFDLATASRKLAVQFAVAPADNDLWVVSLRDVSEIDASHHSLLRANRDLEEFNRLAVGRELRMIELKEEVNGLLEELGRGTRYQIDL